MSEPSLAATKVALVANSGWYLYNFRLGLVRALLEEGATVVVVCPRDEYSQRLRKESVTWRDWAVSRSGGRPWRELASLTGLTRIYREEEPEVVHHFTIKPVLYGTLAARRAGVPGIVNSVTGLGHVFLDRGWRTRLLRPLIRGWYGWALTRANSQSVFHNLRDLDELARIAPRLCRDAILTNGSGVDLDRFDLPPAGVGQAATTPLAVFAGRLLREKGIDEFVEAARLCRDDGLDARFVACGGLDPGNPSSVTDAQLDGWRAEGVVEFPGHVDHLEDVFREATCVVLPSYGEGRSRVLMEAAAMGKACVTTDTPGCRDTVTDNQTGLLVPPRNPEALSQAITRLLVSPSLCRRLGDSARRRAATEFDSRQINSQMIDVYGRLSDPEQANGPPSTRGIFTLSLDLELAWGTRWRGDIRHLHASLDGTRAAVAGLLELFERYEITATWALVAALLLPRIAAADRQRLLEHIDTEGIDTGLAGESAATRPWWYAEDLLEQIRRCRIEQELACHTFSHPGIDPGEPGRQLLQAELALSLETFSLAGLPRPRSFVYPRGDVVHTDLLLDAGFEAFRGPESRWFESMPGTLTRAGLRFADALAAGRPRVDHPRRTAESPWMIPSSQFYSPFLRVGRRVPLGARVAKARRGLRRAAEHGGVFHLWTHPFNLGTRTTELLSGLEQIFEEAARLRDAGLIDVLTMGEIATRCQSRLSPLGVNR